MSKPYGNPIPHTALGDFVGTRDPWRRAVLMPDGNIATCNGHVAMLWTKMPYPSHIPKPPFPPSDFLQRWEKIPFHLFSGTDFDDVAQFRSLDECKRTISRPQKHHALATVGKGALARVRDLFQLSRLPRARIQITATRGAPICVSFNGGLAIIGAITRADAQSTMQIFPPKRYLEI